jgi:hypothetical protein
MGGVDRHLAARAALLSRALSGGSAPIVPDALFLPDATGEHVDTLNYRAPTRLDLEEIVTAVAVRSVGWLGALDQLLTASPQSA